MNWFSTYRVHHRVADHFRRGRVFIAGGRRHIHSPAGGQGMNTGIGDAVNLAWKLATVIRGRAEIRRFGYLRSERIAFARTLVRPPRTAFFSSGKQRSRSRMIREILCATIAPCGTALSRGTKAQFRLVSQTRIHYRNTSTLSRGRAGSIFMAATDSHGSRARIIFSHSVRSTGKSISMAPPGDALRTLTTRWSLPIHSFPSDEYAKSAGCARATPFISYGRIGHIALAQPDQNGVQLEKFSSEWITESASKAN